MDTFSRFGLASSLVMLFACGGAQKAPDAPVTSEPSESASAAEDMPAAASSGDSAPLGSHASPAPPVATAAAPAPVAAAYHPAPSVTGTIDGKPFSPKLARVLHPMQKDGRIALSLVDATGCDNPGETTLTILVPWQDGYKTDLSALKRASKKSVGEIGLSHRNGSKSDLSTTFKASGTVTVISAATAQGATGKMKIDLQSGDYLLEGDLDVLMCVAAK